MYCIIQKWTLIAQIANIENNNQFVNQDVTIGAVINNYYHLIAEIWSEKSPKCLRAVFEPMIIMITTEIEVNSLRKRFEISSLVLFMVHFINCGLRSPIHCVFMLPKIRSDISIKWKDKKKKTWTSNWTNWIEDRNRSCCVCSWLRDWSIW